MGLSLSFDLVSVCDAYFPLRFSDAFILLFFLGLSFCIWLILDSVLFGLFVFILIKPKCCRSRFFTQSDQANIRLFHTLTALVAVVL